MQIIRAIPTNIVTGALGVGKTTVIKQLLANKPANERWAVLVNEFGEVGIDGALLTSTFDQQESENQSIFLREIPGGCMCCASGLPMQIGLNQLIAQAKPHRLLIEPTGLGHPKELIQVLSSEHYRDLINLQSTLCLTDARKLASQKWREHQTFRDQFEIADIIVASKSDLYLGHELSDLQQYLQEILSSSTPVETLSQGVLDEALLQKLSSPSKVANKTSRLFSKAQALRDPQKYQASEIQAPANGIVKKENQGEGFYSNGWIWPASYWFDYAELLQVLKSLNVIRLKGLMITSEGIFAFNGQSDELDIIELDEANESRLEIITDSKVSLQSASDEVEALVYV